MITPYQQAILDSVAEATCKHCERVVLAGPPCCYKKVYDLYKASQKEVQWLRKIQSKQTKQIQYLKVDRLAVQTILLISVMILIVSFLCNVKGI